MRDLGVPGNEVVREVQLPAEQPHAAAIHPLDPAGALALHDRKVLRCWPGFRRMARALLETEGFRVIGVRPPHRR